MFQSYHDNIAIIHFCGCFDHPSHRYNFVLGFGFSVIYATNSSLVIMYEID